MKDTRELLIETAERLFVERGTDVSGHDITIASGAKNKSAIQYHFTDRIGLIRAVLDKHEMDVAARRHAMLDTYEAAGVDDIRALAAALVEPLAAELSNLDGGPGYLQLLSAVYNRPAFSVTAEVLSDSTNSNLRWHRIVHPLLEPEAVRLHRRFDALRIASSELARRAHAGARDQRLFTSQLVDLIAGLLLAPISDATRRLVKARK